MKHSVFLLKRWRDNRDAMVGICRLGGGVKGKKRSPVLAETKERISKTLKRKGCHPPWELSPCATKGYKAVDVFGEETAEKMRQSTIYYNKTKVVSEESRLRMSIAKRGMANINWKGGVKTESGKVRNGLEIKAWRRTVMARDNYTCQECGARNCWLHAHHIKKFSDYAELRFDASNGVTLCANCHKKTPDYGGKWKRERMVGQKQIQLYEFLEGLNLLPEL